jgi:hypothetical protein
MNITATTLKRMYKDAILQVWKDFYADDIQRFKKALKQGVYVSEDDPGQWIEKNYQDQVPLVIHCENGIPNATDYHDFSDFGFSGYMCHHEKWINVDNLVNLLLKAIGSKERFYHEPINNAVISIARV